MDDIATFHFTVHTDPEIDAQIRQDVEWLRDRILSEFPQAQALFLVGGFGRGEGGVVQRDGRWRPANDYDFEMITLRGVDPQRLHLLGESFARELGIPFVHVENSVAWKQGLRGPSEYTVDLRFGSLALHDPHDVRRRLRGCEPERIPKRDALLTLLTRTSALLWHFEHGRDWTAAPPDDCAALAGQISKALLAVMDAWLIRAGQYHPSYAERLRRFEALNPGEELTVPVQWATEMKLRPDIAELPGDLASLWFMARDLHIEELYRHVEAMAGRRSESLLDLTEDIARQALHADGGAIRIWLRKRHGLQERMALAGINILALSALTRDGSEDEERMAQARHILDEMGWGGAQDWESLRRTLNDLFGKIW